MFASNSCDRHNCTLWIQPTKVGLCVFEATVQRLNQTASNVLHNSLIIRLGKFGPLDYSQMSPLQIRMLSNSLSFLTVLNLICQ